MRNAEATREKILEAAMVEFSAYGIAGARVDRIAKAAGCNKNLIYVYFENKETLFTTVLQKNLTRVYDETHFTPDDLAGYTGRVFDFAMANPDLMRLMAWFNLEQKAISPAERTRAIAGKVAALTEAQQAGVVGRVFPPGFVLTAIMALATAWTAVSPFGMAYHPEAARQPAALREDIANAVRLLSQAKSDEPGH